MHLEFRHELCGSREFAFLPALRIKAELWFGRDANRPEIEIDVAPEQIHDLLLAKTGQQESGEKRALPIPASRQEPGQPLVAIFLRQRSDALRQLQLARDAAAALPFQELGNDDGVIEDGIRAESVIFLRTHEEARKILA